MLLSEIADQADKEISLSQFIKILKKSNRYNETELAQLQKALSFGAQHHRGQKRISGNDYFRGHCIHVAYYLHALEMSLPMIVAGLLHDTLEDTKVDLKLLKQEFGDEIAFLVEGVSKLGSLKYQYYKRHVDSLRKFFIAVAQDMRVVVIKLCDRYHSLLSLQYLPPRKQKRIAEESILIHAQLAQRLKMTQLQQQLNDAAFPYVFPQDYKRVKTLQKENLRQAEQVIEHVYQQCLTILKSGLGYEPTINRRIKSTYSLYKKLLVKQWSIDAIYDVIALRIIVKTTQDCYKTLGLIHATWRPVQNRFKDYISSPKSNGYQSLHTTIFEGHGQTIEIQIKTTQMHRAAEFSNALHLNYKNNSSVDPLDNNKATFHWLDQIKTLTDQKDSVVQSYLKELKSDFLKGRVFVKTPKGDVIDLKQGATVLDFAFAVHTDLGLQAKGGRVNGIYKALKTPLKQQDIVEIIVDKKIKPQLNWLTWAKTTLAKQKLRAYFNKKDISK